MRPQPPAIPGPESLGASGKAEAMLSAFCLGQIFR